LNPEKGLPWRIIAPFERRKVAVLGAYGERQEQPKLAGVKLAKETLSSVGKRSNGAASLMCL
jgi:hypothetical protein